MDRYTNELLVIFKDKIAAKQYEWNGRYLTILNLEVMRYAHVKSLIAQLHLELEGDEQALTFDLNRNIGEVLVFYEKEHFLSDHSYDRYKVDFETKIVTVLLCSGQMLIKSPNATFSPSNALIINYVHYRNILSTMLENKHFVSLHASFEQQMIILSVKHGAYNIGYKLAESRVESLVNLKPIYNELVKDFSKVEFVNFFKDIVINGTYTKDTSEVFWEIVSGLGAFLASADRDYQIYVQTFAFDKIKSKFKEEKGKYFESLEKNIESLNKQVAAFPLTFAASAFAGFQVKENPWILIVICVAYTLYTWVAWQLLYITKYNIETTKADVEKEENNINNSYKFVYKEFETDFANIRQKIKRIEGLHLRLRSVLIALLVLFIIFSVAYGSILRTKSIAAEKAKSDSIQNSKSNSVRNVTLAPAALIHSESTRVSIGIASPNKPTTTPNNITTGTKDSSHRSK